ncbi:hypothetical protein [Planococcus halotolerans]|uniref:hypothetical protein n=1 Tax=Planococcus halotolerans TaxID=2233542 RepID=UPI001091F08E|nr:hypothetical protein [Planococcus halotolerans]QHJ70129.1 hypothetical protein DNR44_005725 [Planococcus halotolerans]
MKMCKVCRKKPRIERRVDSAGHVFCSDDCFEKFDDGPDDFSHPYIDDYDMLRIAYIDWMQNYESDLHKSIYFGYPKKSDLLGWLDETMDPYWDYYGLAGSDGVFSEEIFFYIKELLGLQEIIREWQVDDWKYRKWLKELWAKQLAAKVLED